MSIDSLPKRSRFLINLAAFIVVVAGMRAAAPILMPFFLATFIAIICWPPMYWMHRRGLPDWLAVTAVVIGIIMVMIGLGVFVGTSVDSFGKNLPEYQSRLKQNMSGLFTWLNDEGIHLSYGVVSEYLDPSKIMGFAAKTITGFGNVFADAMLILFTVIFILFEGFILPDKLASAFGSPHPMEHFDNFLNSVKRYLSIKTFTSFLTGVFIAVWLWMLDVDYPVLWGLVAFLLNFIPNIGSILAALPAVLLALVQHGIAGSLYAMLGYGIVNLVAGNIIEPRMMGQGLGLSTLVVFLSLIFWGWVFGSIGMLLSIPFTMIVKIALENDEDTRWIAVLLGSADKPSITLPPVEELEQITESVNLDQ